MEHYGREPLDRQAATKPRGQIFLIQDRCKGCGICISFCPLSVLRESSKVNEKGYHLPEIVPGKENDCVHCQFCSLMCPDFAIFTVEKTI